MTHVEAEGLLNLMRANYVDARSKVDDDTVALWLTELRRLDRRLGERTVRSLVKRCKFWPTLAELEEAAGIVREQAAQERRDAERREVERAWDELELPPLREVPEAVALLERFQVKLPGLQRVDDGVCGDCGRVGERCRIGRVEVCADCARSRLRVADRLHSEAA